MGKYTKFNIDTRSCSHCKCKFLSHDGARCQHCKLITKETPKQYDGKYCSCGVQLAIILDRNSRIEEVRKRVNTLEAETSNVRSTYLTSISVNENQMKFFAENILNSTEHVKNILYELQKAIDNDTLENGCSTSSIKSNFDALRDKVTSTLELASEFPHFVNMFLDNKKSLDFLLSAHTLIFKELLNTEVAKTLATVKTEDFDTTISEILESKDTILSKINAIAVTSEQISIEACIEEQKVQKLYNDVLTLERQLNLEMRLISPNGLPYFPASLKSSVPSTLEDPITLDNIEIGETCGFIKNNRKYYFAFSYDSYLSMIEKRANGSNDKEIFVPFLNKRVQHDIIEWYVW
jgi:hypothetical protein